MEDDIEKQAQEIYDRILTKLGEAIVDSGLSDDDIADLCGKSQPWANRIRRGKRGVNLPFKTILKLSIALKIDLTTLYLSTSPAQSKLKTLLSEIGKMIVNE